MKNHMKIIWMLITTLLISACVSIEPDNYQKDNTASEREMNKNDLTRGYDLDCSKSQVKMPKIDIENNEKIYLLTVNRYRFKTIGLFVIDNGTNFTLHVVMFCASEDAANKVSRAIDLTEEQMSTIKSLYDNIDISKLAIVDSGNSVLQTKAISFGFTSWILQVIQNEKERANIQADNPEYYAEKLAFFKLGEYLWNLAEIDSPLHYKDIVKHGADLE